jgi:hypothetical protein
MGDSSSIAVIRGSRPTYIDDSMHRRSVTPLIATDCIAQLLCVEEKDQKGPVLERESYASRIFMTRVRGQILTVVHSYSNSRTDRADRGADSTKFDRGKTQHHLPRKTVFGPDAILHD